eukprot:jgi/Hompol1/3807/HPOL_003360-RA
MEAPQSQLDDAQLMRRLKLSEYKALVAEHHRLSIEVKQTPSLASELHQLTAQLEHPVLRKSIRDKLRRLAHKKKWRKAHRKKQAQKQQHTQSISVSTAAVPSKRDRLAQERSIATALAHEKWQSQTLKMREQEAIASAQNQLRRDMRHAYQYWCEARLKGEILGQIAKIRIERRQAAIERRENGGEQVARLLGNVKKLKTIVHTGFKSIRLELEQMRACSDSKKMPEMSGKQRSLAGKGGTGSMPEDVFRSKLLQAEASSRNLVRIRVNLNRSQWDALIVPPDTTGGSCVPAHLVDACAPSSVEWAKCLE